MIASTFDNKFKNMLLLPTSSQPSFALYSACAALTLAARQGACWQQQRVFEFAVKTEYPMQTGNGHFEK
jgi:hypothetical protein